MDERKLPPSEPHDTAGQAFVKRIRPAGCVLFLLLAVLVTAICLTSGRDPIPGYTPPESMEYYAENPEALLRELEENVLPALSDYSMTASLTGDTVTVVIDSDDFVAARAAILRYFPESLVTFERGS